MLAFGIAQVNLGGVTSGVEVLTGGGLCMWSVQHTAVATASPHLHL